MPSVFGERGLLIVTPVTVTFSQNSGFTVQKGEFLIVMPSTKTFLQYIGWIKGGLKNPRSIISGISGRSTSLLFFANSTCHFDLAAFLSYNLKCMSHHFLPLPSMIPRPRIVIFSD